MDRVVQKIGTLFVRLITSSHIDQFSNFFHCQNQEKICNSTITTDIETSLLCVKATIENKTSSVTTHLKQLSTGNVFIVSVIV